MSNSAKVIPLEVQNELNDVWCCVAGYIMDRIVHNYSDVKEYRLVYTIMHYQDIIAQIPAQAEFLTTVHTAK